MLRQVRCDTFLILTILLAVSFSNVIQLVKEFHNKKTVPLFALNKNVFRISVLSSINYSEVFFSGIPENFCFPVNNSKNRRKSEIKDQSGYLKVAGLFFSITA